MEQRPPACLTPATPAGWIKLFEAYRLIDYISSKTASADITSAEMGNTINRITRRVEYFYGYELLLFASTIGPTNSRSFSQSNVRRKFRLSTEGDTMATQDSPRPIPLSIVTVHGIGRQREHETAQSVARCLHLGATASRGTMVQRSRGGDDLSSALWTLSIPNLPDIDLEIRDAWWDQVSQPPSVRTVFWWVTKSLPIIIAAASALWIMRFLTLNEKKTHKSALEYLIGQFYIIFVSVSVSLFSAMVAIISIPFLLVASISLISRRVRKFSHYLFQEVIGDAWLYVHQSDDIRAHVAEKYAHFTAGYECTLLIGHSQGAEIVRRLIRTELSPAFTVLVGSGEGLLSYLRTVRRHPWLTWPQWLMAGGFPALFYWLTPDFGPILTDFNRAWRDLTACVDSGGQHCVTTPPELASLDSIFRDDVPITVTVVAILLACFFVSRKIRHPADMIDSEGVPEAMVIRSPLDPVAFGTGIGTGNFQRNLPAVWKPREVLNAHTRYWDSPMTGLYLIQAIHGHDNFKVQEPPGRTPFGEPLAIRESMRVNTAGSVLI
ncbi:hypothetical protein PXH69_25850, partial [Rhodococcus qingshengii]